MLKSEFELAVSELVRDNDSVLTGNEMQAAIDAMLQKYSVDNPKQEVVDVSGVDVYVIDVPVNWQPDFSSVLTAEYPIGEKPRAFVSCSPYETPTGPSLEFDTEIDGDVRLTYTVLHILDESKCTIPMTHRVACVNYAAAYLCDHLSVYYANEENSNFNADSVDHASKTQKYKGLARGLRTQYEELVTTALEDKAAGQVASWPKRKRMF